MCVCVCLPVCVDGFLRMCVCVGGWVGRVVGCEVVCVCVYARAGRVCLYVCVCVCVCVYGLCVYVVWCSSHPQPPSHTQAHAHTQNRKDSHAPPPLPHTINESKQPPTRPTPTHCPPTHPHTYLDSGCVTVRCLGGGGLCVCVCLPVCVDGFLRMCVCVGGWVGRVVGCEVVCVCVYARVGVRCGKGVSVCVCVCVCVWLVRICGLVLLTSSAPPPTHRRTPTPRTKETVMHPPPSHIPSMKANSPPLDPHPHTARPHTLIRTWTVDVSRLDV